MTNGGVASLVTSSGATRASRRSSFSAAKPAIQSTLLPMQQSNQDSGAELQGTPATKQKLNAKGSSIPAGRQRVKGREGSSGKPAGSSEGNESGPERREGEQQPIGNRQEAGAAPSIAEANYVWVLCDLCSKWRELPKGHTVSQQPLYHPSLRIKGHYVPPPPSPPKLVVYSWGWKPSSKATKWIRLRPLLALIAHLRSVHAF